MSGFVSVRDVVFGQRTRVAEMTSTGDVIMRDRAYPTPVAVTSVVSAIEVSETYYYDDFGRFVWLMTKQNLRLNRFWQNAIR